MSLLTLLETLVKHPTETKQLQAANECFEYIEQYLTERSMIVNKHDNNGYVSLVATSIPTKNPKVLLQAHIDVVPAPEQLYELTESDGKLYGRGVFDMKFAAASFMQLADDFKDDMARYDFGIMFTSDEEIGGENGVKYLLDEGYGAQVCILPDGGNNWEVEEASNGVWFVRLTAKGKTAHGSRPWEGSNAIMKLVAVLDELCQAFGELGEDHSSITVSRIKGGDAINQVPDLAEATVDMRFVDMDDYQAKRAALEAIVEEKGVLIEELSQHNPQVANLEDPAVVSFLEIAGRIRGRAAGRTRSCGSSDARFFNQKSIPTIVTRPTGGGAHGDDEWLDRAEFEEFHEVIKAYVTESARQTP